MTTVRSRPPRQHRHGARGARGARRGGFTLIEVLVALTILATVLVGLAAFMTRFVRSTTLDMQRARAADLAAGRLEAVRATTSYDGIDGWRGTEAAIAGSPGFVRVTTVKQVSSSTEDYKIVTVHVTSAALRPDTVRKTTVVPRY
ncbi:MAG TPA: prepilin-type N-terminal cleavage/methylation domain-containing protein [Gemmatimonadales bacterium]